MKKILPFILLSLALTSCGEDLKFNNEAVFQGLVDNVFWRGGNAKATVDANNKMVIEAVTFTDHATLEMPVPATPIDPKNENTFVTYSLGTSNTKRAFYTITIGDQVLNYETATGVGDGEIVISEYDGAPVSGRFRFNAKNTDPDSDGNETLNMQSGVFYKVPIFQAL